MSYSSLSASGFCTRDGFNVKQCLQVWYHSQRLDLLHCHVLLASSAALICLVSQWQLLAGIALPLDTRNKLVCVETKDYIFGFQRRVSAV